MWFHFETYSILRFMAGILWISSMHTRHWLPPNSLPLQFLFAQGDCFIAGPYLNRDFRGKRSTFYNRDHLVTIKLIHGIQLFDSNIDHLGDTTYYFRSVCPQINLTNIVFNSQTHVVDCTSLWQSFKRFTQLEQREDKLLALMNWLWSQVMHPGLVTYYQGWEQTRKIVICGGSFVMFKVC